MRAVIKIVRSMPTVHGAVYSAFVDGKEIASHYSSNDSFGRLDLKAKKEIYEYLFPDGYEFDFEHIMEAPQ